MTNSCCNPTNSRLIKRARDNFDYPDEWDGKQILQCRECKERFIQ